VLAVQAAGESHGDNADGVAARLRAALAAAGIEDSVGAASTHADHQLGLAVDAADRAMYQDKARRTRLNRAASTTDPDCAPPHPGPTAVLGC